ncbi:MAG: hypothetical protein HYS98_01070 [Deltaproteobacteria bacterium]|nr:hypothetical protein [Deltaproteobacteria bacterium]
MKKKTILYLISIGVIILNISSCSSLKSLLGNRKAAEDTEVPPVTRRVTIGDQVNEEQFNKWVSSALPRVTEPVIEKKFISDTIQGNTYVPGHFIYVIKSQSQWSRE